MKMRTPHMVPLAVQTIEILKELEPLTGRGQYVFPLADTPRQAYYKVWLESLMGKYLVRKESGTKKYTLDKRIWKFDDLMKAEKFYIRKIKEKTNPNRKSKRKYKFAAKE